MRSSLLALSSFIVVAGSACAAPEEEEWSNDQLFVTVLVDADVPVGGAGSTVTVEHFVQVARGDSPIYAGVGEREALVTITAGNGAEATLREESPYVLGGYWGETTGWATSYTLRIVTEAGEEVEHTFAAPTLHAMGTAPDPRGMMVRWSPALEPGVGSGIHAYEPGYEDPDSYVDDADDGEELLVPADFPADGSEPPQGYEVRVWRGLESGDYDTPFHASAMVSVAMLAPRP
jgi:hypothetical protein